MEWSGWNTANLTSQRQVNPIHCGHEMLTFTLVADGGG